ncbi:MAG: hypothetical protein IPL39_18030 [Opitutaceae bacterium]|nr:hypothetical protein [Opitutaceae bacterium]
MSTDLTCFVLGIPLIIIWVVMMRKGVAVGSRLRKVYREEDPIGFWLWTGYVGMLALGFTIMPVLHWTGLR